MIVLHEHDGIGGRRLLGHGSREFPIHLHVVFPIRCSERWSHVRDVAKRPQAFVGEAVVVAGLLRLAEPDPPQLIVGRVGRHGDAIVPVDHVPIGRAAAMSDPRPRARAHDRLQRRDQPARGTPDLDAAPSPEVDIRFPVGGHEHFLSAELVVENRPQRVG